jgi:hypothetical protein
MENVPKKKKTRIALPLKTSHLDEEDMFSVPLVRSTEVLRGT